ncbi:MAG: leucine-rich repeat domain-containing protein [Dehalococcoidia bacterium]|nr:leucine-rich repeat domain-containing protein [Dehalococcoidia bacterium]
MVGRLFSRSRGGEAEALARIERARREKATELGGLTALPDAIGQLAQLRALRVSNNKLAALPDALGQLTQLRDLYVSNNNLAKLPESLKKLTSLRELYLHGNDRLGIPREVLGPTSLGPPSFDVIGENATPASPAAILDYYFRVREL